MDGSSNSRGSGIEILMKYSNGDLMEHSLRFCLKALNNEVEYEALIVGFKLASKFGATSLKNFKDSQLVVN